tara:strand:- start:29 stop:430 length:402 start_codon:yes stop_codon:yes gene_type:complete
MANGTIAFDTLTTSDSVKTSTEKSIDTSYIFNGVLKAWSHITTHNTVADSLNVSSVTDQGTGQSNDTFTNPFANTTYCINYGIRDGGGTNDDRLVMSGTSELFSTSQYGVYCVTTTTLNDADFLFLQYVGDLA